jgi:esterase/lipase superfamily enzyme
MQRESHQWFTERLGRAMGLRVYGHWGMPLLAFPTSGGDEWEMEGQGMVAALEEFIDGGRIKLFCVGSNGDQSFYDKGAHPFHRSWMQRQWDEYIRWEVVPFIHSHCNGLPAIATMGASLGAYHAANTLFKHPDAVRVCFAMSGLYDLRSFMDGLYDDNFYFNNPIDYIGGMTDPWQIGQISSARVHISTGTGPFEHPSHSYALSRALSFKGISHHLDDWGPIGGHDWPYWKHQMREYLKGI